MKKERLALIADAPKKEDLLLLLKDHRDELRDMNLIGTRSTGQLVQSRLGVPVTLVKEAVYGGLQQIGALVAAGEVTAVIYLRDPMTVHKHEADMAALMRMCDVHNIPLALNVSTGAAILTVLTEYPEVLNGHALAAAYLDDMAAVHD